jgi:hypothetical protein
LFIGACRDRLLKGRLDLNKITQFVDIPTPRSTTEPDDSRQTQTASFENTAADINVFSALTVLHTMFTLMPSNGDLNNT